MPDVSLNGIEFQIKGSTGNASSSIDSLVKKLDSLKTALANAGNVKVLANGLKNLQKAMESIAKSDVRGTTSALKELGKTAQNLQGLANMSKDLASFARAMVKLSEDPSQLLDLAQALQVIGSVDLSNLVAASDALRSFSDAMRAVNSGSSRSGETEAQATAWSKLGDALRGVANIGAKGASGIFKLLSFPFKGAVKNVGAFAKSLGDVGNKFKRILGYRIIRSIIKEIEQAFGEGIKNLYGWSKAMGGATISGKNFAQTMDGLATSSAYFKNSIGAMVAPIISALAPAIDYIIDKVVALINVINQLMALLGGATSWNKAIRKASEFEDAAGGAGGAAKEALRYLAPFDELNRLPDDNKGGGGGGSGDDYSGMFEEQTEFLEGLKDFADSIRAAIDAGDWEGLGVLIGDKVNELIEKIDFASLGTKVGEKINALFTTEYWTLNTINFQNIGKKIAEFLTGENGIGGALREIDFSNIGGIMAEKLTALPETLIGVVNSLDFSVVGKSLGDIIKGFANDMADQINKIDWGTTLRNIVTGIVDFIKGLDINGIVESILKLTGSIIGAVIEGIGPLLVDLADTLTSPDTWALVTAWLADLPAKMKQAGISAINALGDPIIDGLNSLIEKINSSGLAKALGIEVEPIEFKLIPDIPKEELTKNYDEAKRSLEESAKNKPVELSSTANFTDWEVNGSKNKADVKAFTTWSSTANWKDWEVYGSKNASTVDKFTTWGSTADWNNWSVYGSKSSSSVSKFTTWSSTADWKDWKVYGSKSSSNVNSFTTWDSTANWNRQTIGNSWGGTTWDSTAKFTGYAIESSLQDPDGRLKVNGTFNIVKLTGNKNIDQVKASGGVYTGGGWKPVQSFAGGGSPFGGQIFRARENGNPELVGTLRGSTAVMNNDQIVASVSYGVARAIAGIHFQMTGLSASAPAMEESANEDTMYRAFRRALDETDFGKDISIDGEPIYQSVVRRNRQNTRATGVNQLAMA